MLPPGVSDSRLLAVLCTHQRPWSTISEPYDGQVVVNLWNGAFVTSSRDLGHCSRRAHQTSLNIPVRGSPSTRAHLRNDTGEDDGRHRRCDSRRSHTVGSPGGGASRFDRCGLGGRCRNSWPQGFVGEIWSRNCARRAKASDRCDYCVGRSTPHARAVCPWPQRARYVSADPRLAFVFGYAQQVFTRLVDRQGQNVLDGVRGADRPQTDTTPP